MLKKLTNNKKFIALLTLICIVTTILLSVGFIISHVNHDCVGDDCPVCAQIHRCLNVLNNITVLYCSAFLVFALSGFLIHIHTKVEHFSRRENTPVGLKVQMNN